MTYFLSQVNDKIGEEEETYKQATECTPDLFVYIRTHTHTYIDTHSLTENSKEVLSKFYTDFVWHMVLLHLIFKNLHIFINHIIYNQPVQPF